MTSIAIDLFRNNKAPSVTVVDITPDLAREWMARNIGNRPASQAHVAKLVKAINEGHWKMTGDPIRFSKTGKLLDGQHRLQAIINSGRTITCIVMEGLEDEIFDVLDSGKGRQKSDVLFIELGLPVETCKMLASAVTWIIDYEKELFGFPGKSDKSDVMAFVQSHPATIAAAEYGQSLPRNCPVPRSVAAAFYYYASKRNQAKAERFLERFMVGAVDGPNDNLLALRNRCFACAVDRRPLHRSQVLNAMIRIWNAELRGKPIQYAGNALRKSGQFQTFI